MAKHPDVAVIGAGAFGSWTAWHLLQRGARVTLVDAWGAGHPRGTSSGETRLLRCGYGQKPLYTAWTLRALQHWKHWQQKWRAELFVNTGVLWLFAEEDDYVRASLAALLKHNVPHERLNAREVALRFPQMNTDGIRLGFFEPRAGFLRARLATMRVAQAVAAHPRGRVLLASVETSGASSPAASHSRLATEIHLFNGTTLRAGAFVFACGPWLPQMFPDLLGRRIRVTKQEVFFFGLPPGPPAASFEPPALVPWIEIHSDFYGVPAFDGRGLKIACDRPGPLFDPTRGEREPEAQTLQETRRYMAHRFPAMAGAPLAEVRVCQYERTPDSNLVIDRHPDFANLWLVGGGSGHGFKLGPAIGEFIAEQVLARSPRPIPPEMRLGASAWPASGPAPITHSF